eukprot:SM000145S00787  [mRNA]  locus=s145:3647:8027:- [translate_table: standard]
MLFSLALLLLAALGLLLGALDEASSAAAPADAPPPPAPGTAKQPGDDGGAPEGGTGSSPALPDSAKDGSSPAGDPGAPPDSGEPPASPPPEEEGREEEADGGGGGDGAREPPSKERTQPGSPSAASGGQGGEDASAPPAEEAAGGQQPPPADEQSPPGEDSPGDEGDGDEQALHPSEDDQAGDQAPPGGEGDGGEQASPPPEGDQAGDQPPPAEGQSPPGTDGSPSSPSPAGEQGVGTEDAPGPPDQAGGAGSPPGEDGSGGGGQQSPPPVAEATGDCPPYEEIQRAGELLHGSGPRPLTVTGSRGRLVASLESDAAVGLTAVCLVAAWVSGKLVLAVQGVEAGGYTSQMENLLRAAWLAKVTDAVLHLPTFYATDGHGNVMEPEPPLTIEKYFDLKHFTQVMHCQAGVFVLRDLPQNIASLMEENHINLPEEALEDGRDLPRPFVVEVHEALLHATSVSDEVVTHWRDSLQVAWLLVSGNRCRGTAARAPASTENGPETSDSSTPTRLAHQDDKDQLLVYKGDLVMDFTSSEQQAFKRVGLTAFAPSGALAALRDEILANISQTYKQHIAADGPVRFAALHLRMDVDGVPDDVKTDLTKVINSLQAKVAPSTHVLYVATDFFPERDQVLDELRKAFRVTVTKDDFTDNIPAKYPEKEIRAAMEMWVAMEADIFLGPSSSSFSRYIQQLRCFTKDADGKPRGPSFYFDNIEPPKCQEWVVYLTEVKRKEKALQHFSEGLITIVRHNAAIPCCCLTPLLISDCQLQSVVVPFLRQTAHERHASGHTAATPSRISNLVFGALGNDRGVSCRSMQPCSSCSSSPIRGLDRALPRDHAQSSDQIAASIPVIQKGGPKS